MIRRLSAVVVCAAACARGVAPSNPTPLETTLAARLEAMAYRGVPPRARVGDLMLERTRFGAVRVVEPRDAERPPGSAEDDIAIEAAIRGALSLDPMLAPMNIDVDVDGGIVRLSGELMSRGQAARAVTVSLRADGVRAVESRSTWVVAREKRILVERSTRPRVR
jgi:hypothetical protein